MTVEAPWKDRPLCGTMTHIHRPLLVPLETSPLDNLSKTCEQVPSQAGMGYSQSTIFRSLYLERLCELSLVLYLPEIFYTKK